MGTNILTVCSASSPATVMRFVRLNRSVDISHSLAALALKDVGSFGVLSSPFVVDLSWMFRLFSSSILRSSPVFKLMSFQLSIRIRHGRVSSIPGFLVKIPGRAARAS